MELTALNDMKNMNTERNLTNDIELEKMDKSMNELGSQLEEYLKNNEFENLKLNNDNLNDIKNDDLNKPIDIDITTGKNEFGDTTILGKITIEKSAAKDLEKIQNKMDTVKDKSVSIIKNGLSKVYDLVKDTFIEKIAEKVLKVGGVALNYGAKGVKLVGSAVIKLGKNALGKIMK